MNNEVLAKILTKKAITINDRIKFRTIFDVLSAIFTNENHVSILKSGYKINNNQEVWFPNITPNSQKEENKEYANYMSENWDQIYQFDNSKSTEKRKKLGEMLLKNKTQFITFAKINEKSKGIGYHFIGIFTFTGYLDETCKTMIYQKISDSYKFSDN